MITDWAGVVWKKLPFKIRSLLVRATQAKFTASAAVVIVNGAGKVLLLDHRIRPGSGWGLPGGFLEHGELPAQGIRREIAEETGLDLSGLTLLRVRTVGKHIEVLFSARSDGTPKLKSDEIKGFRWFAAEQLPEEMNPGQRDFILKVLGGEFEKGVRAD
jgi:ADP-ribose pyrophosphatase YjhB (NUDIX family)